MKRKKKKLSKLQAELLIAKLAYYTSIFQLIKTVLEILFK